MSALHQPPPRLTTEAQIFFQPVQLHFELTDLLVKLRRQLLAVGPGEIDVGLQPSALEDRLQQVGGERQTLKSPSRRSLSSWVAVPPLAVRARRG